MKKTLLNGLGRALCSGKPHGVPKAVQSVNMRNTSARREEGGGPVGMCMQGNAGVWLIHPILQLVVMI